MNYAAIRRKVPFVIFVLSLMFWAFAYGVATQKFRLFPYQMLSSAQEGASKTFDVLTGKLPWYFRSTDRRESVVVHDQHVFSPGLTLVTGLSREGNIHVKVITREGEVVHQWLFDWFDFWPNPGHIPEDQLPQARPATEIHGIALLENGDLLFNMDGFGLSRVDICGSVVWQLPARTHHAIDLDDAGNIWVPSQNRITTPSSEVPNYRPPFEDYTVLQVTPEGTILREISMFDLLIQNGLQGLLYMSPKRSTEVTGGALHMNDVEIFPSRLQPGIFAAGDVMVSLRNINAIAVFNPDTLHIKFLSIGQMVRQHDPDFLDGNHIAIFDNNYVVPQSEADNVGKSKIVVVSAIDHQLRVIYSGSPEHPFYTYEMGKHQWLPNGNILITESLRGRAFEIDSNGKLIWEFFNLVDEGRLALLTEAQRLAPVFTPAFFTEGRRKCGKPQVAGASTARSTF